MHIGISTALLIRLAPRSISRDNLLALAEKRVGVCWSLFSLESRGRIGASLLQVANGLLHRLETRRQT